MSQEQLEKKVADYLRKSQALEDYWQGPITAEQLQAEMDRMAKHTRQPEVLRELFEALGNDPFVIAECLARPALADRLLTNWYAYDQRIHGELKQRAEADLLAHPAVWEMRQLSGKYSEIEVIRGDSREIVEQAHRLPNGQLAGGAPALQRQDSMRSIKLNSREWDETVQKLAAMFGDRCVAAGVLPAKTATITQIKTGVLSPLQEDEWRYYATAVIEKTSHHLKLAAVSWLKEPLESWIASGEDQAPNAIGALNPRYTLPTIAGGGCIDNTWTGTAGPPDGRVGHTAVWTGSEMIVWGGFKYVFPYPSFNTGARYNPSTDNWVGTTITDAPTGRYSHTAVWTGSEMIVWGGSDFGGNFFNTGGRYDPATDSWTTTSTTNPPVARSGHTAIWTGSEMIIWGGYDGVSIVNTGGRYNPVINSWTATTPTNAPVARYLHTAVWSGSEMIVWAGVDESLNYSNTGGRYNPGTDSWTTTSLTNVPDGRELHTAVWTGTEMIVWGGDNGGGPFNTGGTYNPSTNSWTATSLTNAPSGRSSHTAVWSGSEMIVWGGFGGSYFNTGGKYNPNTNSWTATGTTDAPTARSSHAAVWTGSEMIVWGGAGGSYAYSNVGGRYNPMTDSWVPTGNTPTPRQRHTAVWTGSEMIVWGGFLQGGGSDPFANTGGRYTPSTDSWMATSTTNAPTGRYVHTAVWTGTEMIVWGGYNIDGYLNTGGRYNPSTDIWAATSTSNAPLGRESHTAVWTGSQMIIWGGYFYDGIDHYLNTGGKYSPSTDTWIATNLTNAPAGRGVHTAVWTGSEMVVWGGADSVNYFNTGGRYNPSTDSWLATTTSNAPSSRDSHRTVWTGSEMIVWGGFGGSYFNTGGKYNPNTNSWTQTSISGAPEARSIHTAVWTGNEMIIWGGQAGLDFGRYFDNGGKYNPATDTWTPTGTINAPDGRYRHTAVWTGNEMIVWGGILYSNSYTGTGGRYCAQSGPPPSPTPTPTPCTGRCSPTPRPRPSPTTRPTPPPHITPVPPPPSPRPTAWPRPTPPPHLTPVPPPPSPRPTPAPRPSP